MIRQFGVLAYRTADDGGSRVLLITSRETRRWVIPRGNPIAGLQPHLSAAREAWEEAGVTGAVLADEIGSYHYGKRRRDGTSFPALVHVFPLRVEEQAQDWPERSQRESRWFEADAAAEAVEEPELKALILGFRPPPPCA